MGNGLVFRLLGFPVRIEPSFLLVVGILGYTAFVQLDRVVAFVVIAVVSVLVHELGHAVAARSQGAVGTPAITLAGMAGLTRYRLASDPSRLQAILISFAGPFAGLVLGGAVLAVRRSGIVDDTGLVNDLFDIGLFTTLGWSAFNLLPIMPLDGGHIMTDLLPGSPLVRRRRSAVVSIVVAGGVGAWLWIQFGSLFGPVILAMIAMSNISVLTRSRQTPTPPPPVPPQPGPPPRE